MRIKKLDIYLLKSFIGPFIITFFVVLFALVMQSFWLYMDEILGKGFSTWIIIQYLGNMAVTLSPMALPLATLLTGIMTFGTLGEHFELAAIKSAGIPLTRFMRPLALFAALIALLSFLTSNYITPNMNLKTFSLMYDLRKQKPAFAFQDGIFNNDIPGYIIRIGSKSKDGNRVNDVLIYEHKDTRGNRKVTKAKSGSIYPSPDNKNMIFELNDGWNYDESQVQPDMQQTRMYFEKYSIVFDISSLQFQRTEEELFKNNEKMKNVGQLYRMIDSMNINREKEIVAARRSIGQYITLMDSVKGQQLRLEKSDPVSYKKELLEIVPDSVKRQVYSYIEGDLRSSKSYLFNALQDNIYTKDTRIKVLIELHQKITMALACLLLFLIGAPLGGIIRKGGIGMPVVVGVAFFVIYFIIGTSGAKLAKEGSVAPWAGVWLSTFVLTPIAIVTIHQASTDSRLISKETYARLGGRIAGFFRFKKNSTRVKT